MHKKTANFSDLKKKQKQLDHQHNFKQNISMVATKKSVD